MRNHIYSIFITVVIFYSVFIAHHLVRAYTSDYARFDFLPYTDCVLMTVNGAIPEYDFKMYQGSPVIFAGQTIIAFDGQNFVNLLKRLHPTNQKHKYEQSRDSHRLI